MTTEVQTLPEGENLVDVVETDATMIGDPDNGIPKVEVDPSTGDPIEASTDDTPKYSEMNAVQAALNAKPVEFENEINGLLASRLEAAVDKRREEVAKSIFNGEVPQPEADNTDAQGSEEAEASEPVAGENPSEE